MIAPNKRPSSPALDAIVTEPNAVTCAARAWAAAKLAAAAASNSARRASKCSMLALVAITALPCGIKKLRAKPDLTLT